MQVRFYKAHVVFIVIILFVFLYHLFILFNSSLSFYSDDAIYAELAKMCFEEGCKSIFHPFWQPLYPFLSALTFFIIPSWEDSLRFISTLAGTLLLIPLYYLFKESFSRLTALLFIAIISFASPLLTASLLPLSDNLSALFITGTIVTVYFSLKLKNYRLFILSGFINGLAFLTRPEGSLLFLLTSFYMIFFGLVNVLFLKKSKNIFLYIIFFVITFFVTSSPYLIANRILIGEWSLSPKFAAQIQQRHAFGMRDNKTTWAQEIWSVKDPNFKSIYYKNGYGYLIDRIYFFTKSFQEKYIQWKVLFFTLFPTWALLLIIIGIIGIFKRKLFFENLFFIFITSISIFFTMFFTAEIDPRYLAWVVPFLLFFLLNGIYTILKLLSKSSVLNSLISNKFFYYLVPVMIIALLPLFSWNTIIHPLVFAKQFTLDHKREYFEEIASWIKTDTNHLNPKIMMRHEIVAFYADGETIYMPFVTLEEMIDYAKRKKVDYIIAWDGELASDEHLRHLTKLDFKNPNLKRLKYKSTREGNIIIYSIIKK